jgi:endonuclease/exonuclease/phosphatase family metal-dependent hydrolase
MKLITLNCYLWPYGTRHNIADPKKSQRWEKIKKMIAQNKNAIICLQEFYSSWWDDAFKRDLLETFSTRSIVFGGSAGWGFDSGLVIISPYPIIKHSFVKFQHNPGVMSWANRGFLSATIIVKGQEYQIINTHLHPIEGHVFASKYSDGGIRRKQLKQIRSFYGNKPTILVGDFNTSPYMLEIQHFVKLGEKIISPEESTVHSGESFCSHKIPDHECDFAILYNCKFKNTNAKILKNNKVSDHWPVFIKLQDLSS